MGSLAGAHDTHSNTKEATMATTTRVLTASVSGTVYTSNANGALEAIDTCHSGTSAPTDEVANGKFWLDTTTTPGILKIYNNSVWEVVLTATGASLVKLDGIEASADVTDETNVTAAGALMDSEVTNLAAVKAFDGADYATAAQGTLADDAAPLASPSLTGTPTAPTAVTTTNTTQIATTEFVQQEIAVIPPTPAGVTVISTTVVSTPVASVDLTGFVPADYTSYEIELINVIPVADNVSFNLRTSSDGGSTWDSVSNGYYVSYDGRNSSNQGIAIGATTSSISISGEVGSYPNEDGVSGTVRIHGPHLTKRTMVTYLISYADSSGRHVSISGGGVRLSSADVDGVQLLFSTGNIESGTIVFRGIK